MDLSECIIVEVDYFDVSVNSDQELVRGWPYSADASCGIISLVGEFELSYRDKVISHVDATNNCLRSLSSIRIEVALTGKE